MALFNPPQVWQSHDMQKNTKSTRDLIKCTRKKS